MNELAFPSNRDMRHNADWDYESGMKLRDYFAAKAMQSLITLSGVGSKIGYGKSYHENNENLAKCSYIVADAMLAERNNK